VTGRMFAGAPGALCDAGHVRTLLAAVPLALALLLPSVAPAAYVPGELIVRYEPGTETAERSGIRARVAADVEQNLGVPRLQLLDVDGEGVLAAARELNAQEGVAYAHPNYLMHFSAVPNDPGFGQTWGLRNTGQTIEGQAGTAGIDVDAPAAWDITRGNKSLIVAVLDSGIDPDHPDLAPNLWRNPGESGAGKETNGVDDDGNGRIDDWRGWDFSGKDNDPRDGVGGHGSHVAGTIGAKGNNGIGVSGVNWDVTLMPLKVGADDGSIDVAATVEAMTYAGKMGARVANMSFGGGVTAGEPMPTAQRDAIRASPKTLFVMAAGNEGTDNDKAATAKYPCNFSAEPNAICVAATDNRDQVADFSNFGPAHVQIAAPGKSIFSTVPPAAWHDDFETIVPGRYFKFSVNDPFSGAPTQNNWGRTNQYPPRTGDTGQWVLTDSPGAGVGYTVPANSGIQTATPFSARTHGPNDSCAVSFWWTPATATASSDPFSYNFYVEAKTASATAWNPGLPLGVTTYAAVLGPGWHQTTVGLDTAVWEQEEVLLRFRFEVLDGFGGFDPPNGDGIYLDDISIWCGPGVRPAYGMKNGTSMAAPMTAGVAALVAAKRPTATAAQLKQALLGGAEPVAGLAGKVSGGRLNALRALRYTPPGPKPDPPKDPCAGLGGLQLKQCKRSAACEERQGVKRKVCKKRATLLKKCDTIGKRKKKRLCVRRAKATAECEAVAKPKKRKKCRKRAAALK